MGYIKAAESFGIEFENRVFVENQADTDNYISILI